MDYDVVETSDVEELEELRAPLQAIYSTIPDVRSAYLSDDFPRKRIKLYHRYSPNVNDLHSLTPLPESEYFGGECQLASQLLADPTEPTSSLPIQDSEISRTVVDNTTPCSREAFLPSLTWNSSQDPLLLMSVHTPLRKSSTPVLGKESMSSPVQLDSPTTKSVLSPLFTPSIDDSASKRSYASIPQSTSPQTNLDSMPSSPLTMLGSPQAPIIQHPSSPMASVADLVLSLPIPNDLNHRPESPRADGMPLVGDLINTSRYSLRQRQPVQLHPYVIDKLHYKQALQDNPDAMITVRSPKRNRRGPLDEYENDEENETQDIENFPIDNVHRNHRRNPVHTEDLRDNTIDPEELQTNYPEILQDLPTTDEDEEEELQALSKEARELQRKRKKARKKAAKNPKAYPFTSAIEDNGRRTPRGPTTSELPQSIPAGDEEMVDENFYNAAPLSRSSSPHHPSPDQSFSPDSAQWDNRHSDHDYHDFIHGNAMLSDEAIEPDHQSDMSANDALPSKPGKLILDKKRRKALNHMMPTSMIKNLIRQGAEHPRKRRLSLTEDLGDVSEGPLLPGQTRVRRRDPTIRAREIQGDSESSDDDEHANETSSSDVEIMPLLFPLPPSNHEVITLSDSDNNGLVESSDEGIADEDIQAYMVEDNDVHNDIREVNLIDWMLSRTRTIGDAKRQSTTQGRRPRKKRHGLDIVTRGARKYGRTNQTLLSFDKQIGASEHHRTRGFRPTKNKELPDAFQIMSEAANRLERKKKGKQRNASRRTNGLYVFSGQDNTRIVSGRSEIASISVDTETSIPGRSWADAFQPPKSTFLDKTAIQQRKGTSRTFSAKNQRGASPGPENHLSLDDDDAIPSKTPVDTNTRLLPLGLSFGDETYIGKRVLDQLITAVSMTARAPQPAPCDLRGYDLRSDMSRDGFLSALQRICDDYLEFSTGLPEVDHAEQLREWGIITRVVCQLLSWFYDTDNQEERDQLQMSTEKHASAIVDHVRDLNLTKKSLDHPVLQLEWFTVEILARTGCKASFSGSNAVTLNVFGKALSLLVDHLMELDPVASVNAVVRDGPLTSSTLHQQCAELWVCLFHLLAAYPSQAPSRGTIPFWSLALESLRKREEDSNLKASEKVWEVIFCLSALSQFSVHGMTTCHPRLPAAWALVVFAMKKIRLAADPVLDQDLRIAALILRDRYISVITFRCFQLCDKWQWQLGDASELFNELGEIFRSRKFANLRHEKPDCPQFMLSGDWSLLSKGAKTDSAFTLFLKLIVKAAKPEEQAVAELSPKFKKLLSLAIPIGSLPFTKTTPPSQQELSMLFNRYSAVAIGIYLDRASCRTRVSHARTYVAFVNVDISARMAVIRGMMNLANLIRKLELHLDTMAEWIADISAALSDELKAIPMPLIELQIQGTNQEQQQQLAVRCRLHICIQMLLSSIRHILDLFKENREYPEPTLISSLKSLYTNTRIPYERKTMHEMQRLTTVLLDARSNALPPPERPAIATDVNSESQDEYNTNFDFDFNDPSLIAALGDTNPPVNKANEDKLYQAINEANLYWLCWRHLTKFIQEIDEQPLRHGRISPLDNRIYCWIGCADVLVRNGKKSWTLILKQRDDLWKIRNEALRRRVDLGVATQLLKLHPMIYSTHADMFLDVFLESLVSEELTIEHDYASLLLSIDGLRHPLFQGLTEPNFGDYNFSIHQYSSLRLPFLQAILNNLNRVLEHDRVSSALDSALSTEAHIGYFTKGLSAMRSISLSLAQGSEAHVSYIRWCKQLFEFIQGLEYVHSHPKLTYWMSWGRSLEMIS